MINCDCRYNHKGECSIGTPKVCKKSVWRISVALLEKKGKRSSRYPEDGKCESCNHEPTDGSSLVLDGKDWVCLCCAIL